MAKSPNTSLWFKDIPSADRDVGATLPKTTDIVVVGAGITGLHAALALRKAGREVLVIEAKQPGAGTTGHTSAHVSAIPDGSYASVAGKHGDAVAKRVAETLRRSVDEMETRAEFCEWSRVPVYIFAASQGHLSKIEQERGALVATGFRVSSIDSAPLPVPTLAALRVEDQARFHPIKYIEALRRELSVFGVPIICGTRVHSAEEKGQHVQLTTSLGNIEAQHAIMATHYPWSILTEAEAIAYRSYLVAMEIDAPLEPGLYWDTADPYHYVRNVEIDGQTLALVGGSDHRTGFFKDEDWRAYAALEAYGRNQLGAGAVRHQWSAQFYEPFDDLPFIGNAPGKERLWIATGYSGNGLTFGVAAGNMIASAICGVPDPLLEFTRPSRRPELSSASTLISEGIRTGYRYARDRVLREGEADLEKLGPGEADVFKIDGELVAAHRDEDGALQRRSAVCTHMGGIVEWNPHEKSWDCPIHGGRFSCHGKWMEGPPSKDLETVDKPETEKASS